MKTEKQKQLLIEELKKAPIVLIACRKAGIGRATYYRYKKEDIKFSKDAEEALLEGCSLISDLAESQLISAIKDKNLASITYWLRHHHPSYTNKVEISGKLIHSDEELTSEQAAIVKTALRLASFDKKHEK
jgi:hypothetical protein